MKNKLVIIFYLVIIALGIAAVTDNILKAGLISKPHTFTPGSPRTPSSVNENFDTIYNEFNGNINSANIQNNSILDADINTSGIFSAGKVTDTALIGVNWSDLTDGGGTALHTHSGITGSISATQHGDLSGSTLTMHTGESVVLVDAGAYYATDDVESALQALGPWAGGSGATGQLAFYNEGTTVTITGSTFNQMLLVHWSAKMISSGRYCELYMDGSDIGNGCDTEGVRFIGADMETCMVETAGADPTELTVAGNSAILTSADGWNPASDTIITVDTAPSECVEGHVIVFGK